MGLDIAGGHPLGIHGQYLLFNVLADAGLVLFGTCGANSSFRSWGTDISTSPKLNAASCCCVRCGCRPSPCFYSHTYCSPVFSSAFKPFSINSLIGSLNLCLIGIICFLEKNYFSNWKQPFMYEILMLLTKNYPYKSLNFFYIDILNIVDIIKNRYWKIENMNCRNFSVFYYLI